MKKWKHLCKAAILAGVIAMTSVQICSAAEVTTQTDTTSEAGVQSADAATAPATISTNEISGWPTGPEITSETGVLMDADSGVLLYSKGGDEIRYPASITKIMTLLLAVENCSMKEDVVFTETGTRDISWDSGNIGMQVGEVMSMKACLCALIIRSANEVAAQIAEHVGGTEQNFIDMMNQRAQEIGCTNTHFANSSGLPDDNQHTTAHDMALIMQAAIQNESFRTIAAATSYTIPATNKAAARNLTSKFTMTDTGSTGFYEGCIGGKEGYTEASGSTLVCAAQRNGMTLISVVLKGASGQTAPDAASILNYGFDQFVTLSLGDSDFSIISGGDVVVPAGTGADSLTTEDSQNGDQIDRTYLFNGTSVGSAVLEVVQSDDTASVQEGQQHMQAAKDYSDNHTEIPYFVIAGVFLLLLILLIWRIVKIVKS